MTALPHRGYVSVCQAAVYQADGYRVSPSLAATFRSMFGTGGRASNACRSSQAPNAQYRSLLIKQRTSDRPLRARSCAKSPRLWARKDSPVYAVRLIEIVPILNQSHASLHKILDLSLSLGGHPAGKLNHRGYSEHLDSTESASVATSHSRFVKPPRPNGRFRLGTTCGTAMGPISFAVRERPSGHYVFPRYPICLFFNFV